MRAYLVRRGLSAIVTLFLFTALLFFAVNLLIPGDYADTLALNATPAQRQQIRRTLGLDQPLPLQYLFWLRRVTRGNLGFSLDIGAGQGGSVVALLGRTLPPTLLVFLTGGLVAFWLGLRLGTSTAWRAPRWLAWPTTISSIALYTAFPPWLAFLITFILVDRWFLTARTPVRQEFNTRMWAGSGFGREQVMMSMIITLLIMFFIVVGINWLHRRHLRRPAPPLLLVLLFGAGLFALWLAGGYTALAVDVLRVALIPLVTFTLLSFGDITLIMRASMRDEAGESYLQLARAKGVKERQVQQTHAAPNAILPVLTRFVINLPYLLTAIVIVERATNWLGVGDLLFEAIYAQNTDMYMGIMLVVGLMTLGARLVLEVAYGYLDPRIRLRQQGGA